MKMILHVMCRIISIAGALSIDPRIEEKAPPYLSGSIILTHALIDIHFAISAIVPRITRALVSIDLIYATAIVAYTWQALIDVRLTAFVSVTGQTSALKGKNDRLSLIQSIKREKIY